MKIDVELEDLWDAVACQKESSLSWESELKNVKLVGCFQESASMNHVEMSESCWNDTFSSDASDKWNVSAEPRRYL